MFLGRFLVSMEGTEEGKGEVRRLTEIHDLESVACCTFHG